MVEHLDVVGWPNWLLTFFALQNTFLLVFLACRVFNLNPGFTTQHFHTDILVSTGSSAGRDQSSGGSCVIHTGGAWRFEGSIICQVWKQHQSRGRRELKPHACGLDLTDCHSPTGYDISTLTTSSRPVYSGDVCCISHVMFSELSASGFGAGSMKHPGREKERHWCKNKKKRGKTFTLFLSVSFFSSVDAYYWHDCIGLA